MKKATDDLKVVLDRIHDLKKEIKTKEEIQISHEEELERWRKLNHALEKTLEDVERGIHSILDRIKDKER